MEEEVRGTKGNQEQILIYQSDDGNTHIDVKMKEDTVWLTQQQMAELFQTSRTNIVEQVRIEGSI